MIIALLNSCENSMNMMGVNGINGGFHKKNGEYLKNQTVAAECPCCQGADRSFYKLTNGSVIFCCDECSSYWVDPKHLSSHEALNRYGLEEYFGNTNIHGLFNNQGKNPADRATKEEIEKSEWKDIARILGYL